MPYLLLAGSTWVHSMGDDLVRRLQSSGVVHLLWTKGGRKSTELASLPQPGQSALVRAQRSPGVNGE